MVIHFLSKVEAGRGKQESKAAGCVVFIIPRKEEIRAKWISVINHRVKRHSAVFSRHFLEKDFRYKVVGNDVRSLLLPTAVPSSSCVHSDSVTIIERDLDLSELNTDNSSNLDHISELPKSMNTNHLIGRIENIDIINCSTSTELNLQMVNNLLTSINASNSFEYTKDYKLNGSNSTVCDEDECVENVDSNIIFATSKLSRKTDKSETTVKDIHKCDKTKCLGPVKFYEDLNCMPIYENDGDCCAVRYDCSHLYKRSSDKCYANGNEYPIGAALNQTDRLNLCSIGCFCNKNDKKVAKFTCSVIDCFFSRPQAGCYFKRKFDRCCDAEQVCPENPEDIPKCIVEGKTYTDGEIFYPKSENKLICQCLNGYAGNNVFPYCKKTTCGIEEHYPVNIYNKCAPLYLSDASTVYSCTSQFRCQKDTDTIINQVNTNADESNEMICEFGKMKLRIGEELNQSNDFTSKCVKCKCEVPPTLTCQRLTPKQCNAKFSPKN
ncbi:PREDICTED: uncharacterized protein LOC105367708 [Ceratosolen solmsi marchali]|uniref:Uncharacterized protein LOC105367708 n=1 Tax=Ceratosolen solmsi marchali TaxID=326594 RepID=A0AAJ6YUS1_9HYME|nr:PREDICTED: uncharacterized protein LOC105367708 [Ceratosolen solmsi marchali]